MAYQALGPGTTVPRRRVLFGLLDADGWAWAGIKAFIWLILITFILAYIPDRAYYFTVNRTIDLGILAWSPINLCPAVPNESLPCPAPLGAITPWHEAPSDPVAQPARAQDRGRRDAGRHEHPVHRWQRRRDGVSRRVPRRGRRDRQLRSLGGGPALPQPRANASVLSEAGSIYVFGGPDADGEPTTTAWIMTPDPETGELTEWQDADEVSSSFPRRVPARRSPRARPGSSWPGARVRTASSEHVACVPSTTRPASPMPGRSVRPSPCPSRTPRRPSSGTTSGCTAEREPTARRSPRSSAASSSLPRPGEDENAEEGKLTRSVGLAGGIEPPGRPNGRGRLRAPTVPCTWRAERTARTQAAASSTGRRPNGAGNIPEWKHLDASDIPAGRQGAAPLISGPNVFLIGGQTESGAMSGRGHPREHRAPGAVLPVGTGWCDCAGTEDRRGDRAAAGLPERERGPGW